MKVSDQPVVTVEEFMKSTAFTELYPNTQRCLNTLILKLIDRKLAFYVCKRNEPVIVFKIPELYDLNPLSKCNIATIRFKSEGVLQVEPYENGDNTGYEYGNDSITDEAIISKICLIFENKLEAFKARKGK